MTLPNHGAPPPGSLAEMFQRMTGWPSPDKLFAELQRLNNNMERLEPDLAKIAKSTDGLNPSEIRLLTQVLQGMNTSQMISTLKDVRDTIEKLIGKLWGR